MKKSEVHALDDSVKANVFKLIPREIISGGCEYKGLVYPRVMWGHIRELFSDKWVTMYAPKFDNEISTFVILIDVYTKEEAEEKKRFYKEMNYRFISSPVLIGMDMSYKYGIFRGDE